MSSVSSVFSFLSGFSGSIYSAVASVIAGYGVKAYFAKKEKAMAAALKADVQKAHSMLSGAVAKAEADAKADVAKVIDFLKKWL